MGWGKIYEHRQETWVFTWFYHGFTMKPRMFLDKPFTMFYHDIFPVNRQGLASQHPAFVIFTVQIIHPLFENMENNGTIVLQRLCTKVLERPGRWAPGTAGSERWLCPCLSSSRSPEKCVSQHFSLFTGIFSGQRSMYIVWISTNFWTNPGFSRAFGNGYVGHVFGIIWGAQSAAHLQWLGWAPRVVLVV